MWKLTFSISLLILLPLLGAGKHACVHTEFSKNATKYFLHDLTDSRLLAADEVGRYDYFLCRIRIFADYTQVRTPEAEPNAVVNTIKRVTNITANYFYNVLNVTRLPRLYYPANTSLTCNTLKINEKYVSEGVIGDLGVVVGSETKEDAVYIAKSLPCAFL